MLRRRRINGGSLQFTRHVIMGPEVTLGRLVSYWQGKRAVVTGGSSGLGRTLAGALVARGARVAIVARGAEALEQTAHELRAQRGDILPVRADVTCQKDINRLVTSIHSAWGGLDLLCHCAGRSMRGTVLATPAAEFESLWKTNFLSALQCTQAFAPSLIESHGHVILIGSLASKVAAGYLGAYPASKFPLAALAQQLRIELGEYGPHVLLVCPGPIAREGVTPADSPGRYDAQASGIPATAHQPGGGAKLRSIDPRWLADRILDACQQRKAELIVPRSARLLCAIAQLSPNIGDWLLRRMTSG
jgi:NAD(P)-dependent dehydrogenase (short-subunit alcohol dehydrogenase family)